MFAETVSHWLAAPQSVRATTHGMRLRSEPQLYLIRPLQTLGFVYPLGPDFITHQYPWSGRPGPLPADECPILVEGEVWLPPDADQLIMRVFIVAHCVVRGYRGIQVMVNIIKPAEDANIREEVFTLSTCQGSVDCAAILVDNCCRQ